MSGIIGGGSKSGLVGPPKAEHCSVYVDATISIADGSSWYLPDANQMSARHDYFGWYSDADRKITPKKKGLYFVYAHSFLGNLESGNMFGHMLVYAGVEGSFNIHTFEYSSMTNDVVATVTHNVYFDGHDDYIQIKYYNSSSTSRTVGAGFQGSQWGLTYIGEK